MKRKYNFNPLNLRDLKERKEARMRKQKTYDVLALVLWHLIAVVLMAVIFAVILDRHKTPEEWYRGLNPELYEQYDAQRDDYRDAINYID